MLEENIRRARKSKGYTQEEMAAHLNIVRQTVSKWEKGASVPDADMLIKISNLLEVPVQELLELDSPHRDEDLAAELARINSELAERNKELHLYTVANQKRGLILFLSFAAMFLSLSVKNEMISLLAVGGCIVAGLVILYRNLSLFSLETQNKQFGIQKAVTIVDIALILLLILVAVLSNMGILLKTVEHEKIFAAVLVTAVILFGGFVSPKLPFSRHTGLRLPWTVQDEDTWKVAHRIIGVISLPVAVLYVTAVLFTRYFEAVTLCAMLLWIGIPAIASFAFWWKKYHGRL